jgi:hypothetical protein
VSGSSTISTRDVQIGGLSIQNTGYGVTIPIVYGTTRVSPTLIEYTNFISIAHTTTQSGGGKGGGVSQQNTTYTYTAAIILALCEGPIAGFGKLWLDKDTYASPSGAPPAGRSLSMFAGTYPQTSWSWMQTYNDGVYGVGGRALGYQGIAYAANANYDLGNNASLGNHSFEVVGVGTLQNSYDVNALDVVADFLNNTNYGANFPYLGSITAAWNYCQANGIFISPCLDTQKPAQEWLKQFARIANVGLVWSGGTLKVIPYGDQTITANGATYTPNTTPVYDLNDDDFQPVNNDPVTITRKRQADAFNAVQVEYLNRNNQYNIEPAEVKDQANIEAYGLRTMPPVKMHEVCVPTVAKLVAQTLLQRELYIRNEYSFALSWKYCLLEPMDIVTLTDTALGLNFTPVRITSIEENYDGLLTVTAEEMPLGVSQPAQYPHTGGAGYQPNFNIAPPNSNAPLIFSPPMELAANSPELWMAACGPAGWGGCNVWVSSDNATYKQVGTILGNARMGTLVSTLATSATDPDLTNTLHVDLTSSLGVMYSGTQADADLLHTLCYVDGEFVSYQNAVLTSAYNYDLSYLRRGAYNSVIAAHAAGAKFARLDDAIFKLPYTAEQIGTTLYVKLQAVNQYQGGYQDLATLTPTTVAIPAPPVPFNVNNFAAQQNGNVVVFTWTPVKDYALKGYDIGYAPQGETNWNNFILLTETARGTEMTNAAVPPGTWVFGIRAKDVIGQLSAQISMFNLIVTNASQMVASVRQDPGWAGAIASMVAHISGVLVPMGTKTCDLYGWQVFDQFVPDPVAACSYTTPMIDTGYDSVLRIYSTSIIAMGYAQAGAINNALTLDTWLNAGSDLGTYTPWTVGQVNMRYMKQRMTLNGIVAGAVPVISAFSNFADTTPVIENVASVVVAPGGTAVTFPQPYHSPPFVLPSAIGVTALVANASAITATGCTLHIFNSAGTDVGGTATYTATGS